MKKFFGFVKKHKVLTAVCLIAVVVLTVALLKPADPMLGYTSEVAQNRDIITYNSFVGNVGFMDEMNALAMASAEITDVLVEAGDSVSKGDVLVVLDSSAVEKNIEKAEISIKNQQIANEHSLADAKRAYENFKYAIENGLNASLNGARTQLDSAQKNYDVLLEKFESYIDDLQAISNTGVDLASAAMLSARKSYCQAVEERDYYVDLIETYENKDELSDKEKGELERYKELLALLELNVENALSEYKHLVRNYADHNDSNFKTLVDNIENAQIALDNATESYDATKLQIDQQLESYEATYKKAQDTLNLESAEKELNILKETLDDYKIVAPCDGIITTLNAKKGNMAAAGNSLATIADTEHFEISVKVDEYSVLNTKVGKDVVIYIDSIGRTYDGKITWIANNATIENGVSYYKADVEFTADEFVRGGMSVEVRLVSKESYGAVSLSVDAINYRNDNTAYVLVKNEHGEIEERTVSLGVSDGIYVEITEGVSAGDEILYTPSFSLMIPMPN